MAKIRDEVGVSRLFTVAERVDVEAALLLLGAAPSLVRGKRWDVWPRLCSAMRQWHDGRVAARKDLLRDDQARWLKYRLTTMLYTSYMKAVQSQKLFVPKLPAVGSGTSTAIRRSICLGFVNRVVQGTREPEMALLALACFRSELTAAGWGVGLLSKAVNDVVIKSGRSGEVRSEVLAMLAMVMS